MVIKKTKLRFKKIHTNYTIQFQVMTKWPFPPTTPLGGTLIYLRPDGRFNPSSVSWVCSGVSSQLVMPEDTSKQSLAF